MNINELKKDTIAKQKKGVNFMITSILIWILILIVSLTDLHIYYKNLLIFCSSAILMPVAYLLSKIMKIDFQNRDNPLSKLGFVLTLTQLPYLLIVMWAFNQAPSDMLMLFTMVFGAHLFPFGWLYESKGYYIMSIVITLGALIVGLIFEAYILPIFMIISIAILVAILFVEMKKVDE